MRRSIFLYLTASLMASSGALAEGGSLGALKWKARPIVVLSDGTDDPRVARQLAAFERTRADLDDRDIKVLQDATPGSPLRKRLGLADRGFAVVLVGKDGDVKRVWRAVVDPKRIFSLIDQMPMRQEEMRR